MEETIQKETKSIWKVKVIILSLIGLFGVTLALDRYVVAGLTEPAVEENIFLYDDNSEYVNGEVFISTIIKMVDIEESRLLGGYRPDNLIWFGGLMPFDNVENFQKGVMEVLQRTAIFLKERVSRAGGGSDEFDDLLVKASEAFNYKKETFILTAWQLHDGLEYLDQYRQALKTGKSVFMVRTDSLFDLLRAYRELLGDTHQNLAKWKEKDGSSVSMFITDDYFYHSLGEAYAVLILMKAVKKEFGDMLQDKGCLLFLNELETSLEHAMAFNPPWVVLDGHIYSQLIPNHRGNLDTFVYDARYKVISMMDNIKR